MNPEEQLRCDLINQIGPRLTEAPVTFNDVLGLDHWINQAAACLANDLYQRLDPPPQFSYGKTYIVAQNVNPIFFVDANKNNYHSMAIFDVVNDIHFVPVTHIDYFFLSIPIQLKPTTVEVLDEISESLQYNNSVLSCGGDFPGATITQMAVVRQIDAGIIKPHRARDLYQTWVKMMHEEWVSILKGEKVEEAKFSIALERYILTKNNRF